MRRVQRSVINIRFVTDWRRKHLKRKTLLHSNIGDQRIQ
jgi:hypothetical protein